MKASEIEIGGRYVAKVSGDLVTLQVTGIFVYRVGRGSREQFRDGWSCLNTFTGRTIRVKSPQRFRSEA